MKAVVEIVNHALDLLWIGRVAMFLQKLLPVNLQVYFGKALVFLPGVLMYPHRGLVDVLNIYLCIIQGLVAQNWQAWPKERRFVGKAVLVNKVFSPVTEIHAFQEF